MGSFSCPKFQRINGLSTIIVVRPTFGTSTTSVNNWLSSQHKRKGKLLLINEEISGEKTHGNLYDIFRRSYIFFSEESKYMWTHGGDGVEICYIRVFHFLCYPYFGTWLSSKFVLQLKLNQLSPLNWVLYIVHFLVFNMLSLLIRYVWSEHSYHEFFLILEHSWGVDTSFTTRILGLDHLEYLNFTVVYIVLELYLPGNCFISLCYR